ncbi:MAG: AIR synthase-related protein [Balneolaceae bacterium]
MSAFDDDSGKINSEALGDLILPFCGSRREEVVIGPGYGVDTGVIDLGNNRGMAVSSDPLSLIPSLGLRESAWLSVHLLVNDMATTGFAPMYAQFVFNLSPELSREDFRQYWKEIHHFCKEAGVAVTGGHTGQIVGQNSTISGGGTMFLTAPLDKIVISSGAEPGDRIVVTKELALASTSILAMSFPQTVRNWLGREACETAHENFYRTSVLQDALAATEVLEPNRELKAMHDVTEGGVLGAIVEMAEASGCGFRVENSRLPIGDVPRQIAGLFEIDPRFCVGAGAMVLAVKSGTEEKLVRHLESCSIPAAVVGEFTGKEQGNLLVEDDGVRDVQFDGNDPYWTAFFRAMKEGWT